ncbi:hypothetical protein DSO57_1023351 [Entomophthora muscae]|uniref:Uncharacterized protein n=1 Tax=Entomophthora muscae TaxID=34485 RepID=A0ACC2RHI7_9FUNG|nr:hypothetical protein DSO57_1023351 [Entomophthora muscae]
MANQVVPHTGIWRPLATAVNYLVCIAPIVYMAFQARPASPVGVQSDSGMGRDTNSDNAKKTPPHTCTNPPDADQDQATLNTEKKARLRALGPHICIMDFEPD